MFTNVNTKVMHVRFWHHNTGWFSVEHVQAEHKKFTLSYLCLQASRWLVSIIYIITMVDLGYQRWNIAAVVLCVGVVLSNLLCIV